MSSRPRLVATDLDGTILRSDGTISGRTRSALRAVESGGSTVVIVTGRPPREIGPLAEAAGHRGLAICANGAAVYDLHTERLLETHLISVAAGLQVARCLREELVDVGFAVETVSGFAREAAFPWSDLDSLRVAPLEEFLDQPLIKLLAWHGGYDGDALVARAREVAGHLAEITHSSRSGLIEISAAGVSKATALAGLCARWRIAPTEVVAFGDMPNDLSMLEWAGTAYAVANGHPVVLARADRHTASNDEDGVARVLEQLFG